MKKPFALLLLLSFLYVPMFSQDEDKPDDRALIDSLSALSPEGKLNYVKKESDYNKVIYSYDSQTYTIFEHLAHDFGYYNSHDTLGIVAYMVTHSKTPLRNPYFFTNDPSPSKVNNILEYFSLLLNNKQHATQQDFEMLVNTFYLGYEAKGLDYQNTVGKTVLMYACSFQYDAYVNQLIAKKVNLDIVDKNGKTALMYACATDNQVIIKALIAAGANKGLSDKAGKKAADYCTSKTTRKLVKG